MSHTSPASFLVWAILTSMLGAFLLFHLWSFDKFRCLKWNSGPHSGAFKRVMTYSYMLCVPLILVFSVGNAIIKYREGFILHPEMGVIPKPYQLWAEPARRAIFPLLLVFSVGWSLEMVTHLEELCFWLFLVNAGTGQQDWFRTMYFKAWVVGSAVAVLYMPLVTILSRSDPIKSEAYTFLAGSLGSLSLTVWFTPVLWAFPHFLNNMREEGVDMNTIVRLTKFSELNFIRIIFRFLFTVPLLILGADGVRPHKHINETMAWTDFLTMLAGFGCVVSSGITLVIFFPRSVEGEIATRDAAKERKRARSLAKSGSILRSPPHTRTVISTYQERQTTTGKRDSYLLTPSPTKQNLSYPGQIEDSEDHTPGSLESFDKRWTDEEGGKSVTLPPIRPNRRKGQDVELGGIDALSESNLSFHNARLSNVNPLIQNFRSPIELAYVPVSNESRLTFAPR